MKRTIRSCLLLASALPLAACADRPGSPPQVRAPAATVAGEAISCIQSSRIRESRVHDDYTIDFRMVDGKIYRNTLPYRCATLGFEQRFAYASSTGQLCSTDTITVLTPGAGVQGPTCGLGQFVPVTLDMPAG